MSTTKWQRKIKYEGSSAIDVKTFPTLAAATGALVYVKTGTIESVVIKKVVVE